MGALTTWTVTCQYEEKEQDPKGHEGETGEVGFNWDYRVYCYERGQGQWVFSKNTSDSFAPEREYMTLKQEQETVSWMVANCTFRPWKRLKTLLILISEIEMIPM